jgi:hypothetical protein
MTTTITWRACQVHEGALRTSYRGTVSTTRAVLIELFGDPAYDDPQDAEYNDCTVAWALMFNEETKVTLYDCDVYTEDEAGVHSPGLDELYSYHVGGSAECTMRLVESVLGAPGAMGPEISDGPVRELTLT